MIPTIGRIVHYKLNESDVTAIQKIPGRRNSVSPGEVYPAMIVRVFGAEPTSAVNLQVFLDGDQSYWATSRMQGDEPFQWHEPPRVTA